MHIHNIYKNDCIHVIKKYYCNMHYNINTCAVWLLYSLVLNLQVTIFVDESSQIIKVSLFDAFKKINFITKMMNIDD